MNTSQVKAFFEKTDVYLTYNYNLRIRAETLGSFLGNDYFESVLDMPCGTGDISAPFIGQFGRLTLMDFSENMIATAKSRFADEDQSRLTYINTDFYDFPFGESRYDLILNIGILAHIKDPMNFLRQSISLLKPGGTLILQNTNSDHPFARLIFCYLALRRLLGIDKYALNKISEKELLRLTESEGLALIDKFSYNQSFLGLSRLFSNDLKYKLTRRLYGFASDAKKRNNGSDTTFIFRKKADS